MTTIYSELMHIVAGWRADAGAGDNGPEAHQCADELEALAKRVCAEACDRVWGCDDDDVCIDRHELAEVTQRSIIGSPDET